MLTWSKTWPTEPGHYYADMCNHLADTLAEQCAEIGRVTEEPDQ